MELKGQPLPLPRTLPERRFWIGLACVILVHVGAIFSVGGAAPRQLGERDGKPDAISVELVEPSALRGAPPAPAPPPEPAPAETAASPTATAAASPTAAAAAAPTATAPAGPTATTAADPAAAAAADPAAAAASPKMTERSPVAAAPAAGEESKLVPPPTPQEAAIPPLAALAPPSPPSAGAAGTGPTAKAKSNPKPPLQLDLPQDFAAPIGLSTAAVRPPDITRSGENDEFGRRVIRALRQTMPPARGELGRVTVRLRLSTTGDLMQVELVRPAADPILTQNVVFAVKQSNFPIPPSGATLSDRTFLVTYIYN
jgi:periplasmic protein TonB